MVKWIVFLSLPFFVSCMITPASRFSQRSVSDNTPETQSRLQEVASSWVGCPYQYGGNTREGIDCSGLVRHIYSEVFGIELPRTTGEQYAAGSFVRLRWLTPGDLVFFRNVRGHGIDHVGVYLGSSKFIHASSSQGVVISSLNDEYYRKHFAGARRLPIPDHP